MKEREILCVCVCVCERERNSVKVSVCNRERELKKRFNHVCRHLLYFPEWFF